MTDDGIDVARKTVESAISEGDAHIRQMDRAATILATAFPLTAAALHSLPDDTVPILDQFIYRFTKLQDSMATRLLPSLHAVLRMDSSPRPFLDILTYLEQLGAVTSEQEWQFFRALRNNLAHDYPESAEQTAQTLNTLHSRWPQMKAMFTTARDFYREFDAQKR